MSFRAARGAANARTRVSRDPLVYTRILLRNARRGRSGREVHVKKWLGLFGLIGAAAATLMFWRRQRDDDEFLDEELD
jgi:hypothetical protein